MWVGKIIINKVQYVGKLATLVIEMFTSKPPQPDMKGGHSFNEIVIRRLLELIDDSVQIILVVPMAFKVREDITILLQNKDHRIIRLKKISELNSIFNDTSEPYTYFSPMNLEGFDSLPSRNDFKIYGISYLHDLRDFEVYRLADTFIENEKFFYRVYRFKNIRNFIAHFLISTSPKIYLLLMKRLAFKWLDDMKKKTTRASYIIVNSRWTFNQARKFLAPEINNLPITIIHPPKNEILEESEIQTGTQPERFFLAMMANRKEKNISVILKAFAIFCKSGIDNEFKLVITGADTEFINYVKRHFDLRGKVEMKNYISQQDLHNLLWKSSAVLVPSIDEGFGHPILEAMEAGKKIICSNIEVFHEFCNGNCEFFAPYDYETLARIMQNSIKKEESKDSDKQKFSGKLTWYSKASNIRLDMIVNTIIDHIIR